MGSFIIGLGIIGLVVLCGWTIIEAIKHPDPGMSEEKFNRLFRKNR